MVIPSFAVGRTQELLYFIREIKKEGLVTGHGNFTVYIDSHHDIEAFRNYNFFVTYWCFCLFNCNYYVFT